MLHTAPNCTRCCCMLLRVVWNSCSSFHTTAANTNATTPSILGPKMLGVVASVCTYLDFFRQCVPQKHLSVHSFTILTCNNSLVHYFSDLPLLSLAPAYSYSLCRFKFSPPPEHVFFESVSLNSFETSLSFIYSWAQVLILK